MSLWICLLLGWAVAYGLLLRVSVEARTFVVSMWHGFLRSASSRTGRRRVASRSLSLFFTFLTFAFSQALFFLFSPLSLLLAAGRGVYRFFAK